MDKNPIVARNDLVLFNLLIVFILAVFTTVLLYAPAFGTFDLFIPLACLMLNVIIAYNIGLQKGMLVAIVMTFAYGSYVVYDAYSTGGNYDFNVVHVMWMMFFPIGAMLAGNLSLVFTRYRRELNNKADIEKLVSVDSKTGFYKENEFFKKLDEEFIRAKRYKTQFSILVLQITNYDELQIIYGDVDMVNILKTISEYIQKTVRMCDGKFAIGDDKLIVLLTETDEAGARVVVEKLHMSLERVTTTIHGGMKKVVRIKPSIGAAGLREQDQDSLQVYERAIGELSYDKG